MVQHGHLKTAETEVNRECVSRECGGPKMDDRQQLFYDKIVALRRKYRLGFVANPGGGEFFPQDHSGRCQVWLQDFEDDYNELANWLHSRGETGIDSPPDKETMPVRGIGSWMTG